MDAASRHRAWRARSHLTSSMASYHNGRVTFTSRGEPQTLDAPVVSAEFFRVLGVRPLLGRDFQAAGERPGARVAVLSYALWQSAFGAVLRDS